MFLDFVLRQRFCVITYRARNHLGFTKMEIEIGESIISCNSLSVTQDMTDKTLRSIIRFPNKAKT